MFVTAVVNGKPTGPGGVCFRCQGKGYQTDEDRRRNWGYDQYAARQAVTADLGSQPVRATRERTVRASNSIYMDDLAGE